MLLKLKPTEAEEQIAVADYCAMKANIDQRYGMLIHIPNQGKRTYYTGKQFKRMGMKAGVPDLFLAVANLGCHGLFIELKTESGIASAQQKLWIERLKAQGYWARICVGAQEAIDCIDSYLQGIIQ